MKILVTVCSRGGSKGVPNKNVRLLDGKPLIVHTLEQIGRWGRATDVVVSTDSDEIARVARDYGAQVPFLRPAELAADEAPKIPAIRHALIESERIFRRTYEAVVDLDATAPIRGSDDLENCYRLFAEKRPLTLFSVVEAHKNPYFNMVEKDASGYARLCKTPPKGVHRRQDSPKVYDMNASIYFYQRDYLLDEANRGPISEKSLIYVMDPLSAFDIDREIDFKFVEFLVREKMVIL